MGYSTTFKLKGELDEEFKPISSYNKFSFFDTDIKEDKIVLMSFCLITGVKGEDSKTKAGELEEIYKVIKGHVRAYVSDIIEEWKEGIVARLGENNEITFCGWEHARGGNTIGWETRKDLEDYFIEALFTKAIYAVGSPFDEETQYYKKHEDLLETISDIENCVYDLMDSLFIKRYRDSADAIEDGDDTPVKEEQKDEEIIEK